MLILLIWDLTLRLWALPVCLLPHSVCQYSQFKLLNPHLIQPHTGRRNTNFSFIGSVPWRNSAYFRADDWMRVAEVRLWWGFYAPSLHFFLYSLLDVLGIGHIVFLRSVTSRSWRWAGMFTSRIWESAWLVSEHLWPYAYLGIVGLPVLISLRCLVLRFWSLPFLRPVSLISWAWLQILGYLLLCFSNMIYLFSWTILLLFLWVLPILFLPWFLCFQTPQPQAPSPSHSETQYWVVIFFSPLWRITSWVRSCTLVGRF